MRIAVVGGTGFVGSRLVARLGATGCEVSAHGRSTGLDLLTGEGLRQAVDGAGVVVDTIDAPSFDAAAAPFFRTTTQNLLAAAEAAGVGHVVLLSIVGIDRVPDADYYRAKVLQEDLVKAGPVPYSIVRATQFMEFIAGIMDWTTEGKAVHLPTTPLQPIAADEVVDTLAEVATGTSLNGTLDIAGPEAVPLDELGRATLRARPDGRRVVVDPSAGLFAAVPGDALTAPSGARLARTRYADWLDRPGA
ncbi:SDR family oxidoreductase [Streptacidiphilus griseoplanus]|uniref:SDR family oxidoreductase n=1 Tax=Peterkaempfera griseoplana TaxID=66896 RepID=UPI0006E42EC4|nr:NAD(P)H-binding protein [Peterkaempfera griseoplana]